MADTVELTSETYLEFRVPGGVVEGDLVELHGRFIGSVVYQNREAKHGDIVDHIKKSILEAESIEVSTTVAWSIYQSVRDRMEEWEKNLRAGTEQTPA